MRLTIRAKSVAVFIHLCFKFFTHYLMKRLLQQAVLHRLDAPHGFHHLLRYLDRSPTSGQ